MLTTTDKLWVLLAIIVIISKECAAKKSSSSSWHDKNEAAKPVPPLPPIVTYDQRQNGKYNINVNIKDVAIISIDPESLNSNVGDTAGDYEDYYDYDLNDYTISPIAALLGGTSSKKPSTASASVRPTATPIVEAVSVDNVTHDVHNTPETPVLSATTQKTQNVIILPSTPVPSDDDSQHPPNQIPVHIVMEPMPSRNMENSPIIPIVVNPSSVADEQHPSVVLKHKRAHPIRSGSNNWNEYRATRLRTRAVNQQGDANRRCARGHTRDVNGRCQATASDNKAQRSGIRKIMGLLSMLAPKE